MKRAKKIEAIWMEGLEQRQMLSAAPAGAPAVSVEHITDRGMFASFEFTDNNGFVYDTGVQGDIFDDSVNGAKTTSSLADVSLNVFNPSSFLTPFSAQGSTTQFVFDLTATRAHLKFTVPTIEGTTNDPVTLAVDLTWIRDAPIQTSHDVQIAPGQLQVTVESKYAANVTGTINVVGGFTNKSVGNFAIGPNFNFARGELTSPGAAPVVQVANSVIITMPTSLAFLKSTQKLSDSILNTDTPVLG